MLWYFRWTVKGLSHISILPQTPLPSINENSSKIVCFFLCCNNYLIMWVQKKKKKAHKNPKNKHKFLEERSYLFLNSQFLPLFMGYNKMFAMNWRDSLNSFLKALSCLIFYSTYWVNGQRRTHYSQFKLYEMSDLGLQLYLQ